MDRFRREQLAQRKADAAERRRVDCRPEQGALIEYEAIGMSPASASVVVSREPHERMWDDIEAAGEAHHEDI